MASFTFYGATEGPMDVVVELHNAAGVISVVGSVGNAKNTIVIDPMLSAGLLASRRGRIAGPDHNTKYELSCYCGHVSAEPAQAFLLVRQGARKLKCYNAFGIDLPVTAQGVKVSDLAQAIHVGTDFRVIP